MVRQHRNIACETKLELLDVVAMQIVRSKQSSSCYHKWPERMSQHSLVHVSEILSDVGPPFFISIFHVLLVWSTGIGVQIVKNEYRVLSMVLLSSN